MPDYHAPPIAGGRVRFTPTGGGDYTATRYPAPDPLDGATDDERRAFAKYAHMSRLELLRELRRQTWDAAEYRKRAGQAEESLRLMPALYRIEEMAARHRRVRALLDVPRRRTVPRAELAAALDGPLYTDSPEGAADV